MISVSSSVNKYKIYNIGYLHYWICRDLSRQVSCHKLVEQRTIASLTKIYEKSKEGVLHPYRLGHFIEKRSIEFGAVEFGAEKINKTLLPDLASKYST